MARRAILAILAAAVSLLHTTSGETLLVGDSLGWLVPPGGPLFYATWAGLQTFNIGDVLLFNFTTGTQDVAKVTKEAYLTCNSTNPISLKTTGPANFTLDAVGEYYFIGTMDQHCLLGQRLAIYVTIPGPTPSPAPYYPTQPRGPVTFTVGNDWGWVVRPGGEYAYKAWAYGKIFMVGDTLVFNFVNGTQDVALVNKEAYETCNTTSRIYVLSTSPAKIILNRTGEHFFTCTYPHHCDFGQRLAIHVTSQSTAASPSSTTMPPSSSSSNLSTGSPTAGGPMGPPPSGSAPSQVVAGIFFVTLLSIATTLI